MSTAEQRWDKLVGEFRQLCLFRRQKKWIESDIILTSDLPRSIASWSESFQAEPSVKKSRLDAMFQTEQRRIDDAWLMQELLATRLNEQFVPAICSQVAEQVRTVVAEAMASVAQERQVISPARISPNGRAGRSRVAFDDIPGVLDLVLAEDRIRENVRQLETSVCQ